MNTQWKIEHRNKNRYMTDKIYMKYHIASMHNEKTVSLQSPNGEQVVDPLDLSKYTYIQLPELEDVDTGEDKDIYKVLRERRSTRKFDPNKKMTFQEFTKFILFSVGKACINEFNFPYRTYPSGGAKYPVEINIITQRVEGLKDFHVYRFSGYTNRLYDMEIDVDTKELKDATCASKYDYAEYMDCNIFIFLSTAFERSTCKYGLLGYRLTLLEAGHIGQNLSLVAESMDIGNLPLGGFYEAKINKLLGLKKFGETTLYYYLIGGKL